MVGIGLHEYEIESEGRAPFPLSVVALSPHVVFFPLPRFVVKTVSYGPSNRSFTEIVVAARNSCAVTTVVAADAAAAGAAGFGLTTGTVWTAGLLFVLLAAVFFGRRVTFGNRFGVTELAAAGAGGTTMLSAITAVCGCGAGATGVAFASPVTMGEWEMASNAKSAAMKMMENPIWNGTSFFTVLL